VSDDKPARDKAEPLRELLSGGLVKRSDFKIAESAIVNRWNIPPEIRQKIVDDCTAMVLSPDTKHRTRIAATRVLAQLDMVNVARERLEAGVDTINAQVIQVRLDEKSEARKAVSEILHEDYDG